MAKLNKQKKEKARRLSQQIRALKFTIKNSTKALKGLDNELRKVSKRKMRPGGGKPKGGAYENKIAKKIALAFAGCGIAQDDCYRTKNSGATKYQKGDLQFSSALRKMLDVVIECKHYKGGRIVYQLFTPLKDMPKSWQFKQWWTQLEEEIISSDKPGLLIWRENNGEDLVSFFDNFPFYTPKLDHLIKLDHLRPTKILTPYDNSGNIVTMLLHDFLTILADANALRLKRRK